MRPLRAEDIAGVAAAFAAVGWGGKTEAQFEKYLAEHEAETRVTRFAFAEALVPETNDFNVLPTVRRGGIGAALMDEAERVIAARSAIAGIGVGMTADYGAAQRLYVRRGYLPDGRGLMTHERPVITGKSVLVDDDLVLYFTKCLSAA